MISICALPTFFHYAVYVDRIQWCIMSFIIQISMSILSLYAIIVIIMHQTLCNLSVIVIIGAVYNLLCCNTVNSVCCCIMNWHTVIILSYFEIHTCLTPNSTRRFKYVQVWVLPIRYHKLVFVFSIIMMTCLLFRINWNSMQSGNIWSSLRELQLQSQQHHPQTLLTILKCVLIKNPNNGWD